MTDSRKNAQDTMKNIALPVLVTGANGFLGSHLVARFIDAGIPVTAFILENTPVPVSWKNKVTVIYGDIANGNAIKAAMQDCRVVFHLAALVTDWATDEAHTRVTVGGTDNVFAAAMETGSHIVLASSVAVYASHIGHQLCTEDTGFGNAIGPYSRSKQAQERIAEKYRGNVSFTIVRPANVFGPGSGPWLHDVLDVLRKPLAPALINGGVGHAGLVHVENVVDVLLLSAWHPSAVGETFNATDELPVTWKQYFSDIAHLAHCRNPGSLPGWIAWPAAGMFEKVWNALGIRKRPPITREALNLVGNDNRFSGQKARTVLGHVPHVNYTQGLKSIADYLAKDATVEDQLPVSGKH